MVVAVAGTALHPGRHSPYMRTSIPSREGHACLVTYQLTLSFSFLPPENEMKVGTVPSLKDYDTDLQLAFSVKSYTVGYHAALHT